MAADKPVPAFEDPIKRMWFLEGALHALKTDVEEAKLPKSEIVRRVQRVLDLVHAWGHPDELSEVRQDSPPG